MHYKTRNHTLRHAASFPFIRAVFFPMLAMDLVLEIYHRICFPLYCIPCLKRKNYIRFDRHRLEYLSFFDKINCTYCAYANGLAAYFVAIAGETEKYWCGIKHQPAKEFSEPSHHKDFLKYGDEKTYKAKYCKLNKKK